ncbi:choice-of-anchor D domain-containing protein [Rhizobacter sp. OV335]|uniref:choice-of-anchor D domain-containing protein n=1 Tax=Rhizobacter sp. OV335 TaxID=1500264 RepID=UPI00091F2ADC|nr:choice-of-anchor D domain-containing protein [Rhizobacter sp. OV335]SHN30504.1 Abnormal spindle-like microcephaly-assoc'd, ASPM-SPD-2-Hydin [Rhizobacter sp. OV335]
MDSMKRVTLLLLMAVAGPVLAQSATNGQMLFTTTLVAGKQSCNNGACHGSIPANPLNRIANGTSASNIKGIIPKNTQMTFLQGKLTDAQLNDLAAYIGQQLGRTPSYLPTTPEPAPSISPSSISFTSQALGTTSAAQTFSVNNSVGAGAALVLKSIALTAGSDFTVSGGTCAVGTSLAAGTACSVTVSFKPTLAGTRSATLTVGHNGATGSSAASLSGTGVDSSPVVTLSPTALTFAQTVGTSSDPLRVTLGNSGTAALTVNTLTVSGAQASEFAIGSASTCKAGGSVAAGSNCFIDVSFKPTATGARAASLMIGHSASSTAAAVSLAGTGNANAQPGLALDAIVLDLGAQGLATTGAARTATVTNNGQADLKISKVSASGTNAADIVLGGTCAAATVVPAATCTVTVALKPSALGPRSASVEIASNAPGGTASLSVGGVGIAIASPELTLSQPAIGFGQVSMGTSSVPRTVTVSNTGSAALQIASIVSSSTEFKATHDCAASLAPGIGCTLTVTYAPATDNAAETVTITSNAFSSPNSVVLTGQGTTAVLPVLAWSGNTNSLQFASTEVGKTAVGSPLTLVNNGPGPVTVSSIGTSGAQAEAFSVGGGTCVGGVTLAAAASCTVIVSFVPDVAGVRSAVLLVASSGSNPPEVALSGSGVAGSTGGGGGGTTPPDTGGGGGTTPPNTGGGGGGGTTPPDTPATGTLAVTPTALDYRSTSVRTGDRSEPLTVRIANSSATTATISAVTTTAGFIVASGSAADACPGVPWTLAAGKSCTVTVVFAPGTGGAMQGTLKVTSAAGQTTQVPLSAQADTPSTNEGAGALDARWLALLVLAIAALQLRRRSAASLNPASVSFAKETL